MSQLWDYFVLITLPEVVLFFDFYMQKWNFALTATIEEAANNFSLSLISC